jgi:hypothetical protein
MNVGAHLTKRAELNPGLEALVDDAAAQRFTFAERRCVRRRADHCAGEEGCDARRIAESDGGDEGGLVAAETSFSDSVSPPNPVATERRRRIDAIRRVRP